MKLFLTLTTLICLTACVAPAPVIQETDEDIARRRAEIQALENADYQTALKQRRDAIQDLGKMQMNEAKAINKAYENRSKQRNVYIIR